MADFLRKRAILIGVDRYTDVPTLGFCGEDARSVAKTFRDSLQFQPQDILEFTLEADPKPEREIIIREMSRFLRRDIGPDELLIFFFSGHGMINESDGKDYLLPVNASHDDLSETSLSVDFIIKKLTATACKNIVMFIDACREEIGRANCGAKSVKAVSDATTDALSRKGIVTFFSCDPFEKSWEIEEIKHGSFTQCVLDSIAKGGCHTVEDVDRFLRENVPLLNAKYNKKTQRPYTIIQPTVKGKLAIFYTENKGAAETVSENLAEHLDDLYVNGDLEDQVFSAAIDLIERAKNSAPLSERDSRRLEFIKSLCSAKGLSPRAFCRAWRAAERL